MSKMAEVTFYLDNGGRVMDYIPCKDEKGLRKGINKQMKKKRFKLGPVKIDSDSILSIHFSIAEVH